MSDETFLSDISSSTHNQVILKFHMYSNPYKNTLFYI